MNKLPLINTGGNVGSASWMIADQVFRFNKIVLLGMDYSYYIDTPISSTQYYDAIEKVTKDKIEMRKFYKKIVNPHMKKSFYTDHVYLWYRKNFFEMVDNTDSSTINCSQAGILFNKRILWTSLKNSVIKTYKWQKSSFINPMVREEEDPKHVPMGMAQHFCNYIKQGHQVQIYDHNAWRADDDQIKEVLTSDKWDLVGIGGITTAYASIKKIVRGRYWFYRRNLTLLFQRFYR